MDAAALRKHLSASLRLLKKHPGVTIRTAMLKPKAKADKLDGWIEKAGGSFSPETRASMCAVSGLELSWFTGDNQPDEDDWRAFARILGDERPKLWGPVGFINITSWRTILLDKTCDRSNFEPHHRKLEHFYSTERDDYFQVIHLDLDPSLDEVLVRFGDDYGADFASSIPVTVPVYLKLMALTLGTGRKRVLCRGVGSDHPVLDDPGLLPDLTPKQVVAMVIDGDADLRARFEEAVAAIHART